MGTDGFSPCNNSVLYFNSPNNYPSKIFPGPECSFRMIQAFHEILAKMQDLLTGKDQALMEVLNTKSKLLWTIEQLIKTLKKGQHLILLLTDNTEETIEDGMNDFYEEAREIIKKVKKVLK